MVWSDEFSGNAIDADKWSHEVNCTGGGNNELQCYTSSAENSFVNSGLLNIVAIKKPTWGPAKQDDEAGYNPQDKSVSKEYASARLRSKHKGDWRYGRMDIRAKLPQGQGIWPAIWMLPTDWVYGAWPLSGEIDIMEAVNSNGAGGNAVHGTLHYGKAWPDNQYTGVQYSPAKPVWQEFHTYSIEWEAGEIRWYVDQNHYATQTQAGWYTAASTQPGAPFDQLFHLILNLAVGGTWPGNPNAQTQFPQTMQIDFVRVYRCAVNTANGKGCASFINPSIKPQVGNPAPVEPGLRTDFAVPPLFTVFNDALASGLRLDSYNPENTVRISEITDPQRGKVLNMIKTGGAGNVFFNLIDGPADLRAWADKGLLSFDIRVNSQAANSQLLVKMDSGWPNTSDTNPSLPPIGQWREIQIPIAQLIARGNSLAEGSANLGNIANILVLEPSAAMDISLDNIRLLKL